MLRFSIAPFIDRKAVFVPITKEKRPLFFPVRNFMPQLLPYNLRPGSQNISSAPDTRPVKRPSTYK